MGKKRPKKFIKKIKDIDENVVGKINGKKPTEEKGENVDVKQVENW